MKKSTRTSLFSYWHNKTIYIYIMFMKFARSSIWLRTMQLFKIWFLKFLNIFKFLTFVLPLKECPVEVQTYCFSNWNSTFISTVNYLNDNISENIDVSKSKFKLTVFNLFNVVNLIRIIDFEFDVLKIVKMIQISSIMHTRSNITFILYFTKIIF